MARQQFMVGLAVGFAVAVAITLVGFGFGTDLTRNPGDLVLALVIVLVAEAMIVGLAYGYRRLMTRPTEATWQRSALGHGWVLAAVAVALYYLGTTIAQFIDEPTSGNAVALAISVAWTGMIGLGLVLRARRPGSLGTWLAIVGVAPGLGVVWFIPVAVLSLLALVGALAEALGGSARHELRPS